MTLAGVAAFLTAGAPAHPWVTGPSGATLTGDQAFGGLFVMAGVTTRVVAVIGGVCLWRRRYAGDLLQAFGLLALPTP